MPSHDDPPPPPNPLLTAYEKNVQQTAVVTRMILNLTVASYGCSWIISTDYALACIPHFVIGRGYYELYRLFTSIAVNPELISVLFACLMFVRTGNTLEESLGSSAVLWFTAVVFTVGTNCIFTSICLILNSISTDSSWTMHSSSGIWTALTGLLALECCLAAKNVPGSKRKLFFWDIPVQYFPIALLVLFSLLSGSFQLSFAISMVLGYAIGYEYCAWLNVPPATVKWWEESPLFLNSRLRRQGWVLGPAAVGSAAWNQDDSSESRQSLFSSFAPMLQQQQQVEGNESTQGLAGSVFRTGSSTGETSQSTSASTTAGRTLGGASQRHVDARALRLQALERRHEEV